jgi:hypothetical protein
MNSFSLDESSPLALSSVAAEVGGVDRFGVLGRDDGFEPCGVVVVEGTPDDGAAEAMLAGCSADVHAAAVFAVWKGAGRCLAGGQHEICSCCCTDGDSDSVEFAKRWWTLSKSMISNVVPPLCMQEQANNPRGCLVRPYHLAAFKLVLRRHDMATCWPPPAKFMDVIG